LPVESSIFGTLRALPKGPHGLSRDEVAASQRARLMAAMATVVGEKGYPATTIGDVAGRAGVSLRTFYEHFPDKEECYLAAYDVFANTILARLAADVAPDADWHEFISSTLHAYLGMLEAEPEIARGFLVESNAAGPRARRRRRDAFGVMAAAIKQRHEAIRRRDHSLGPLPDSAYVGLVHGVRELVCDALEGPRRVPLTGLAPEIIVWISAMVEGAAAAGSASRSEGRRPRRAARART
jgi:AcrR family transcriptional regulator